MWGFTLATRNLFTPVQAKVYSYPLCSRTTICSVTTVPDEWFREPRLASCEKTLCNRALASEPGHAGKSTKLVRFSGLLVLLSRFVVGGQGILPARGWIQEGGLGWIQDGSEGMKLKPYPRTQPAAEHYTENAPDPRQTQRNNPFVPPSSSPSHSSVVTFEPA